MTTIPMPPRVAKLPTASEHGGVPVPWFVEWIDDKPDYRIMDADKFRRAVNHKFCWLCGEPTGALVAFAVGPMCAVNRISAEPPMHVDCAQYAAQVCPFLTNPKKERRDVGLPEKRSIAGGVMIERNPGVTPPWITRASQWHPKNDGNGGVVMDMGTRPGRVEWYANGREATRDEILESFATGCPALREMAEEEGAQALRFYERRLTEAMELVPA